MNNASRRPARSTYARAYAIARESIFTRYATADAATIDAAVARMKARPAGAGSGSYDGTLGALLNLAHARRLAR